MLVSSVNQSDLLTARSVKRPAVRGSECARQTQKKGRLKRKRRQNQGTQSQAMAVIKHKTLLVAPPQARTYRAPKCSTTQLHMGQSFAHILQRAQGTIPMSRNKSRGIARIPPQASQASDLLVTHGKVIRFTHQSGFNAHTFMGRFTFTTIPVLLDKTMLFDDLVVQQKRQLMAPVFASIDKC